MVAVDARQCDISGFSIPFVLAYSPPDKSTTDTETDTLNGNAVYTTQGVTAYQGRGIYKGIESSGGGFPTSLLYDYESTYDFSIN